MSDAAGSSNDDAEPEIYAKQYFDASPTWNAWNKLRVKDIHALREEPSFGGQNVYFYSNHPIKYVVVVGIAMQIEQGGGSTAKKLCFIKLDDGTEHILNVKIVRREPNDAAEVYPSSTIIDDLDVVDEIGQDLEILVKKRRLVPGSIVRARGTLETYRGVRQMVLDRLKIIDSTTDELQHWMKLLEWRRTVLDRPWLLSDDDQAHIDRKVERRKKAADREARRRAKRLAKQAVNGTQQQHITNEDQELERARLERTFNEGALLGSNNIKPPWR